MNTTPLDVAKLCAATERPPLYERSSDYIWTDDHVGQQMLRFHLDPDGDLASRRHESIDAQVRWITNHTDPALRPRLLDIGCGPGLYCERFAAAGFTVTGLDFNRHSLAYAREHAAALGRTINYRYGNYLDLDDHEAYDVVTLINRDFGALTAAERDDLLARVGRALRPGGRFVFDALSPAWLEDQAETTSFFCSNEDSFWAAGPHLLLEQHRLYPDANAQLDQQTLLLPNGTIRAFRNWITCYAEDDLVALAEQSGFRVVERKPLLADEAIDDASLNVGLVVEKPSRA